MDRFDAMQAFAQVVETGSFTRAAHNLHMSKTTVSQLIQQLEARLRVRLLNRTTRKVNVTADGTAYYYRVLAILAAMDDAETALSATTTAPRGRLRIDVPAPFASLLLIPALPDFYARFPEIQLDLGVSDRDVSIVDERVDCVIRGGEITDGALIARHIADLRLGIYAAPAYVIHHGMPTHPHDLLDSDHRVVAYRSARTGKAIPISMHRADEQVDIHGRHLLSVDDGNACLAAALAGLGIVWLPQYMVSAPLEDSRLVPMFPEWETATMPLYIAYAPNRHVSRKLRVFMDWIAALMAHPGAH